MIIGLLLGTQNEQILQFVSISFICLTLIVKQCIKINRDTTLKLGAFFKVQIFWEVHFFDVTISNVKLIGWLVGGFICLKHIEGPTYPHLGKVENVNVLFFYSPSILHTAIQNKDFTLILTFFHQTLWYFVYWTKVLIPNWKYNSIYWASFYICNVQWKKNISMYMMGYLHGYWTKILSWFEIPNFKSKSWQNSILCHRIIPFKNLISIKFCATAFIA